VITVVTILWLASLTKVSDVLNIFCGSSIITSDPYVYLLILKAISVQTVVSEEPPKDNMTMLGTPATTLR
jgi:hypothetical protein